MKVETRTKQSKYNVYIACDGNEFTSKDECTKHEHLVNNHRLVFVVVDTDDMSRRGMLSNFVAVFSEKEFAEAWISKHCKGSFNERFEVVEHFMDSYKD